MIEIAYADIRVTADSVMGGNPAGRRRISAKDAGGGPTERRQRLGREAKGRITFSVRVLFKDHAHSAPHLVSAVISLKRFGHSEVGNLWMPHIGRASWASGELQKSYKRLLLMQSLRQVGFDQRGQLPVSLRSLDRSARITGPRCLQRCHGVP